MHHQGHYWTPNEMKKWPVIGAAATIAALAAFGLAASAGTRPKVPGPDPSVFVPVTRPSSPYTWPPYPNFPHEACWGTRRPRFGFTRSAPSFRQPATAHPRAPAEIARRLLARFGDDRFIRAITLQPLRTRELRLRNGAVAPIRAPANALRARIEAPAARRSDWLTRIYAPLAPRSDAMLAQWEVDLVGGALRDDLCDAGDRPLIGWGTGGFDGSFAARGAAFGQRFPNPSPSEFRASVELVGRRYGFRVVSLRLLRPRQFAPLLVARTSRDRKAFVRDVLTIMRLLNPGGAAGSQTFEGLFFEVLDADGPFVRAYTLARGQTGGDFWSAAVDFDPCGPHSMPPAVNEACKRRRRG
jgi:hypothetical protein